MSQEIKDRIMSMGFDADMAENLSEVIRITRDAAIDECAHAAFAAYGSITSDQYVLEGPAGLAKRMINAIKALSAVSLHLPHPTENIEPGA